MFRWVCPMSVAVDYMRLSSGSVAADDTDTRYHSCEHRDKEDEYEL